MTPGTGAFVLTKHADVARVVKDPERFTSLTQARIGGYAGQGLSAETAYRAMCAAMVSVTQALYIRHRRAHRGSGRGRCAIET